MAEEARWLLSRSDAQECSFPLEIVTENGFAVKDEHSKPTEEALQDDDCVNYLQEYHRFSQGRCA
ncbi:hypothetical protein EDD22DRAFT_962046 [Suillus occidentalis]|nr:hypothetical protein EDD22DRAFT_962046 [Suillus occidentalis]